MALNLTQFKKDIKDALLAAQEKNQVDNLTEDPKDAPAVAMGNLADELATVIDAYIKTATVSVTVEQGIAVSVEPSSGQGATTSTGSGSGSLS